MGKILAFVLATADVLLLTAATRAGRHDVLSDFGVTAAFALLAGLAWAVAIGTAALHALRLRGSWRWVVVLGALFWLPVLPVLAFCASGAFSMLERGHPEAHA
ncbi:MAG: hypothetical protein ACHQ4H_04190 [Ktedonobacterales bacterium]